MSAKKKTTTYHLYVHVSKATLIVMLIALPMIAFLYGMYIQSLLDKETMLVNGTSEVVQFKPAPTETDEMDLME